MEDLEDIKKKFESNVDKFLPENHRLLKAHFRKTSNGGLRTGTRINHYYTLQKFGEWCKKPFTELTEEDIYDYFEYLERCTYKVKGKPVRYNKSTVYYYKQFLKKFLKGVNPVACAAIELKKTTTKKLPEDILTQEEIEKLLSIAGNNRDRALIATFYESGARKGEILSTKLKHVTFDENGAQITFPEGKTGARRIRLVFAASYLREWITVHPKKENREAPLFCSLREPHPVISKTGLANQLDELAKRAGLEKHLHPHAFRHARATHLAEHLTEQQLKK